MVSIDEKKCIKMAFQMSVVRKVGKTINSSQLKGSNLVNWFFKNPICVLFVAHHLQLIMRLSSAGLVQQRQRGDLLQGPFRQVIHNGQGQQQPKINAPWIHVNFTSLENAFCSKCWEHLPPISSREKRNRRLGMLKKPLAEFRGTSLGAPHHLLQ